jgi:hypothetical protein
MQFRPEMPLCLHRHVMPATGTLHFPLQRLVKDCEEKAEAAKRPSAQQLTSAAPQAANGQQRRASASASSEQDSDDSADTTEPAATKPAAAKAASAPAALAANGGSPVGGSSEDDSEVTSGGAANGDGDFVPNLDKLKKLGKRAGPGGCTHHPSAGLHLLLQPAAVLYLCGWEARDARRHPWEASTECARPVTDGQTLPPSLPCYCASLLQAARWRAPARQRAARLGGRRAPRRRRLPRRARWRGCGARAPAARVSSACSLLLGCCLCFVAC